MTRRQLEHIIRAAANADVNDIVVIGSQSILGTVPNPPPELTDSMEADVFPLADSARSIVIDGGVPEFQGADHMRNSMGLHAGGMAAISRR